MKVILNIHSDGLHTCAVITGFYMLYRQGVLELEINDCRKDERYEDALIEAVIDGRRVVFDLMDGYRYDNEEQVQRCFEKADLIFKRSYSTDQNHRFSLEIQEKIRPYGMNYFVTYKDNPLTKRPFSINGLLKTIKLTDSYVCDFEAPVLRAKKDAKILFLTKLWNPEGADIQGDDALYQERCIINEMRSKTIRLLQQEFGKSFYGGIYTDSYSMKYCPELLVSRGISLKRTYLMRMHHSDICINTMGLHGSTGWKTAEYVAAKRAIVSEEFLYETTGNFQDGVNYLAFSNPEDCVEKVYDLYKNPEKRVQMSRENAAYYDRYLRPDAQVMRAIEVTMGED